MGIRMHRMIRPNVRWRRGTHSHWWRRIRIARCAHNLRWSLRMSGELLARNGLLGLRCLRPMSRVGLWLSRSARGGLCTREWMWRGLNIRHLCVLIRSIDWNCTLHSAISSSSGRRSGLFVISDKNVGMVRHVDGNTAGESRWGEVTIVLDNRRGIKRRERWN